MAGEDADEAALHERALAETDALAALALWRALAARGNPDAPDRLRAYARRDAPELREPARETLEALGLTHDDPMP